jgi:hypothetical protein
MSAEGRLDEIHATAADAACDLDRTYFDEHPEQDGYIRQPVDHELCPAFAGCLDHSELLIAVRRLGFGLRGRMPVWAGARA